MVCSICSKDGHNKKNCPTTRAASASVASAEEDGIFIKLPPGVAEKMDDLASLCNEVASGLGKGHVEGVYQQALCVELQENDIRHVSEETIPILYKGVPIGGGHSQRLDVSLLSYLPGFIFELKAVSSGIKPEYHCQLMRYMIYKKQTYGAVVNFSQSDRGQLEIQFVVEQDGLYYLYDLAKGRGTPMKDFEMSSPPTLSSMPTVEDVSGQPQPQPQPQSQPSKKATIAELREAARSHRSGSGTPYSMWSYPSICVDGPQKKPTIAELREAARSHASGLSSASVWSGPSIWIGNCQE